MCLLKAGADPKIQDKEGCSPIDLGVDPCIVEGDGRRKTERKESATKLTPTKLSSRNLNASTHRGNSGPLPTNALASTTSYSKSTPKLPSNNGLNTNGNHTNKTSLSTENGMSTRATKGTSGNSGRNKFIKNLKKKTLFKKNKKKVEYDDSITVSAPFEVRHGVHVDFNSSTGFSGLPSEWEALLASSGIDKEDVVKNSQAVLDVLDFVNDGVAGKSKEPLSPFKEYDLSELINKIDNPLHIYQNMEKCGEGAAGEVFSAYEKDSKRRVAIKKNGIGQRKS
jgi:hypothetical protein